VAARFDSIELGHAFTMMHRCIVFGLVLFVGLAVAQPPTTEDIRVVSDQIWQADRNRIDGDDVQYNPDGPKLFIYVNEARFTGTFARLIALFPYFIPDTSIPEICNAACENAKNAFLDAVIQTQPMILLHNWLFLRGLAGQTVAEFKEELRQYFFMPYTRSGGPLGSSGFEHVFLGETRNTEVTGFHNWVKAYFAEKAGDFVYGSNLGMCRNEVPKFSFRWFGTYYKPISSMFIRTSPEVEMALYTLCLRTGNGTNCPVRRNGVNDTMTCWDMTGLPKTIGSAYPNC
jgi:poly(U)-specific endoribonuclease